MLKVSKYFIPILLAFILLSGCQSNAIPDEAQLDVPIVLQYPELPRGCEVTSLAMLLQYNGIDVDKMELAVKIAHQPFEKNGVKGNMHKGFIGAMNTLDEDGLGVYVEPIVDLAKKYVPNRKVKNITEESPESLYKAVSKGYPVWVLINARFKELTDDHFLTWVTDEGEMKVTYRQHSVVITGYDKDNVFINNPMESNKNIAINRVNFEKAWIQMGSQAMYIKN